MVGRTGDASPVSGGRVPRVPRGGYNAPDSASGHTIVLGARDIEVSSAFDSSSLLYWRAPGHVARREHGVKNAMASR